MTSAATTAPKRARQSRRTRKKSGYTLVEVMMAIGILTASAVALVGMQETVIHGNIEARQMGTATSIARSAVELLRIDALNWTTSSTSAASVTFSGTRFLRDAPTTAAAAPTAWTEFGATTGAPERAYDYFGRTTTVAADVVYCVQARYAWLFPGQALRADIRVWWPRAGANVDHTRYTNCANPPGIDAVSTIRDLHFVQTSTVLRYTPAALR